MKEREKKKKQRPPQSGLFKIVGPAPWPFEFSRIDEQVTFRLKQLMVGMRISGSTEFEWANSTNTLHTRGPLEVVWNRLCAVLRDDYAENSVECHELGGSFHYSVGESVLCPGALEFSTWLNAHGQEGCIGYEQMILRLGENDYALWVAD